MPPKPRPAATQGSWSPSPSPPASPSRPHLELSHQERLRLLEQHGPMRPSELGLPTGSDCRGTNDRSEPPLVVLSPDELQNLVQQQEHGGGTAVRKLVNGPAAGDDRDDGEDAPDPALWEEVASAVLNTVPFAFLFTGMDHAVHAQFGESLAPRDELKRLANFVPALLLLIFLSMRPPSRALLAPTFLQLLLAGLSVACGLSTIHTCTTQGYLRVMARAPATGVLWCWTVVRLDLGWALAALVGVGVGVWLQGNVEWAKALF
ncbi:hypothetical protein JCM3770_005705 [Rhodotorula araucariae]